MRMTHPRHGTVEVSPPLRDRYLRRGFIEIVPPEGMNYRQLQAKAREKGIPANQSREALERALR